MKTEQCCPMCGTINQARQTLCFACRRSLKATQPLLEAVMPDPLHSSLLLQRYRVLHQVDDGGFSAVYKALDTTNGKAVAIKVVSLHGLSVQEKIEATDVFNREVHFLSILRHRSLPRIHHHFSGPSCWYIVMDFIEGISLERHLEHMSRRLLLEEVLDFGLVLCDVLDYLHTCTPPIVFRDLKPSNILLTPDGRLYLIDFGIARRFIPGRKKDTVPFGSPGYAAPEQYGKAQTTPRSDIYSLGALLHHLLTDRHPELAPFHFASIRQSNPAVPEALEALILTMVEREAARRPESVEQVKSSLRQLVEQRRRQDGLPAIVRGPSQAGAQLRSILSTGGTAATAGAAGPQAQASLSSPPAGLPARPAPWKRNTKGQTLRRWDKNAPSKWKSEFYMGRGWLYPRIHRYKNPHYQREKALWSMQFDPLVSSSQQRIIRRIRRTVLLIIGAVMMLVVVMGLLIWFSDLMG